MLVLALELGDVALASVCFSSLPFVYFSLSLYLPYICFVHPPTRPLVLLAFLKYVINTLSPSQLSVQESRLGKRLVVTFFRTCII